MWETNAHRVGNQRPPPVERPAHTQITQKSVPERNGYGSRPPVAVVAPILSEPSSSISVRAGACDAIRAIDKSAASMRGAFMRHAMCVSSSVIACDPRGHPREELTLVPWDGFLGSETCRSS
eukprot:1957485-Prymnesium_polylepis.1